MKFTLGLCTVKMILNDMNCVSIQVTDTRHIAYVNRFKILVKHSKLNRCVSIYLQKKLCYTPGISHYFYINSDECAFLFKSSHPIDCLPNKTFKHHPYVCQNISKLCSSAVLLKLNSVDTGNVCVSYFAYY